MGKSVYYFGYGSLVNRQTRDSAEQSTRATLHGWERQWAHQAHRPWTQSAALDNGIRLSGSGVSALTIARNQLMSIDGVVVALDESELPILDKREAGYNRLSLPASQFSTETDIASESVYVYVSSDERWGWANDEYPIIHSYVDCVLAGFQTQFGTEGALRFMQTTQGWDPPVLNDRHEPLYPRAVELSVEELRWIDSLLAKPPQ